MHAKLGYTRNGEEDRQDRSKLAKIGGIPVAGNLNMARKQRKDSPVASVGTTVQPPDFMRSQAGRGLEGTKPADIAWIGEELLVGGADRDRDERYDAITREIFNPRYALRLILREIIRSHPIEGQKRSNEDRLEKALTELLGPDTRATRPLRDAGTEATKKRAGGRKALADENLLRVVAREYLINAYRFSDKNRTMKDLFYDAMAEVIPNYSNMGERELDHLRRRLARKFRAGPVRNRVMIEYTGSTDYEARRYIGLTNKILPYFAALGLTDQKTTSRTKLRN